MLNFRPVPKICLDSGIPALYRSGDILYYSEEKINQLIHNYKISYFIDLRSEIEVQQRGLPAHVIKNGLDYISFPIESDNCYFRTKKYTTAEDYFDYYVSLLEDNKTTLRAIFALIEKRKNQVGMFSCYAGKDRTGLLSALLLLEAQAEVDEIIDDYIATGPSLSENIMYFEQNWQKKQLSKAEYNKRMQPKKETMVMFLDYVYSKYGDIKHYLMGD